MRWMGFGAAVLLSCILLGGATTMPAKSALTGPFEWTLGPPILAAEPGRDDPQTSVKDPTVVRDAGEWHVFHSVRARDVTHSVEYVHAPTWEGLATAKRQRLTCRAGYFCAPQVFYFRPHKKWYLVAQANEKGRTPGLQPMYATTTTLSDPTSWTPAQFFFETGPEGAAPWIDFWVICDDRNACLFYTSLNGRMWRMSTKLADFPCGFGKPTLALQADIFEAAHVYRVKGEKRYLAVIEAQHGGSRYYTAYTAETLDSAWKPLAATWEPPFAGAANVRQPAGQWTDNISHGELIRDSNDETLTIDPAHLQFLIQGVSDKDKAGKAYGLIPWKLGLLTRVTSATQAPPHAGGAHEPLMGAFCTLHP
jgi:hypothetical protein